MFIRNPPKQVSSVFMHSSSWLLYLLLIPQQPRLGKSFHLHYIQHLSMWRMRSAHFAFTYDLHNGKHNHLLRAGYRLSGEIMACTERAMGQQSSSSLFFYPTNVSRRENVTESLFQLHKLPHLGHIGPWIVSVLLVTSAMKIALLI